MDIAGREAIHKIGNYLAHVGLICTHGHSGQGGHPHPILEKLTQAGGMKNATAAGANITRNAK